MWMGEPADLSRIPSWNTPGDEDLFGSRLVNVETRISRAGIDLRELGLGSVRSLPQVANAKARRPLDGAYLRRVRPDDRVLGGLSGAAQTLLLDRSADSPQMISKAIGGIGRPPGEVGVEVELVPKRPAALDLPGLVAFGARDPRSHLRTSSTLCASTKSAPSASAKTTSPAVTKNSPKRAAVSASAGCGSNLPGQRKDAIAEDRGVRRPRARRCRGDCPRSGFPRAPPHGPRALSDLPRTFVEASSLSTTSTSPDRERPIASRKTSTLPMARGSRVSGESSTTAGARPGGAARERPAAGMRRQDAVWSALNARTTSAQRRIPFSAMTLRLGPE